MAHVKKQFKLEPPEGGWGYLVCVGMAICFITPLSAMPSFALLFNDFLLSLGEQSQAQAVITMSFFMSMSFAGLFSSSLFNKLGVRIVGLIGAMSFFLGTFFQIFVQTTWQLFITFGIFQGIGFGLMCPASYTTFNNYFIKNRVMMMSTAQSMIGLGTMIYPILIRYLIKTFGFRGCLAINAALNAHCIFGMMLMHPVKWHMRRVEIKDEDLKNTPENLCVTTNGINARELGSAPELATATEFATATELEEQDHLEPLMLSKVKDNKNNVHLSLHELTKSVTSLKRNSVDHIKSMELRAGERVSSLASLGNWTGSMAVIDNSERKVQKGGLWKSLVSFLDLSLLKKPVYVNIALGITFALYSDTAFFTIQPSYLFEMNYSKDDVAIIVATGSAADLLSRITLACSSAFINVTARYIYLSGAFFTFIARFAFLTIFDFTGMAIITAVLGFLRTWIHVTLPLVFAEYLPKERFASGYGLFMFLQGNLMFLIGPIVGYIRDRTQSYALAFHILNIFMGLCAFPWILEILYLKYKHKQSANKNIEMPEIQVNTSNI